MVTIKIESQSTSGSVARHLPCTETAKDQSLAVALMVRDSGECMCGWGCKYLPKRKKKKKKKNES